MDDKKISEEKKAAEEILADEKLDSVAGGYNGVDTGHGYIPTETSNVIERIKNYPVSGTGGGHG